jgi:hypothetical protein
MNIPAQTLLVVPHHPAVKRVRQPRVPADHGFATLVVPVALVAILLWCGMVLGGCSSSGSSDQRGDILVDNQLRYAPASVQVGDNVSFSCVISNRGSAASPILRWTAYRDGTSIATDTVPPVAAGASVAVGFSDTPTTPGNHRYVVTYGSLDATPAPDIGSGQAETTIAVGFALVAGLQVTMDAGPGLATLTATMTNIGHGTLYAAVPYVIHDTEGLVSVSGVLDLTAGGLAVGSARTVVLLVAVPTSGSDTYSLSIDPGATVGRNLGVPASISVPVGPG